MSSPETLETIVLHRVEAFSERDLDATLDAPAHPGHVLPAATRRSPPPYRGHDGVREWIAQLERSHLQHRIVLSERHSVGDGQVFVDGAVSLAGQPHVSPFCAVHRLDGGSIVADDHCLNDPP